MLPVTALDGPDRTLLENAYRQFRNPMYFEAFSITENSADAEDAVQEVFVRIAKKHMATLARLSGENRLRAYLLTAVRNTALNLFEKASTKNEVPLDRDEAGGANLADETFVDRLSDSLDAQELVHCFDRLKPLYRDVLYQRFVLELSVKEIADIDHLPAATVRKRLLRGKQTLRKMFEDKSYE